MTRLLSFPLCLLLCGCVNVPVSAPKPATRPAALAFMPPVRSVEVSAQSQAVVPVLQKITLAWNPSPSPEAVGYLIYWGPSSGNYTNKLDMENATTATLLLPDPRQYYAATAYDSNYVESVFSNEVHIKGQTEVVTVEATDETSKDLNNWTGIGTRTVFVGTNVVDGVGFFRSKLTIRRDRQWTVE